MTAWFLTLGLALGVAVLQLLLKVSSRQPPPGKRHALTIEDAVFWIDWVVAAAVAFCGALIAASVDHKPIELKTVLLAVAVLLLGITAVPQGVRMLCYDTNGRIKGWIHVACADVVGLAILLSSVVAGVKTYA